MGYGTHSVDGKMGAVQLAHEVRHIAASPAAANHTVWRAPAACHVTTVRGFTTGGTSCAINAATASGDVLASNLTCAAGSWVSGAATQHQAMAAGDSLMIKVTAATGSPTELAVQVEYTFDIVDEHAE